MQQVPVLNSDDAVGIVVVSGTDCRQPVKSDIRMTSEAASHKRNMECSLLFLQQEHASTLKALHEEIAKLQKKCSELTFELAMVTPETDTDNAEKVKRLETDLEESRKEQDDLKQDSEKKEKRMKMLEQKLKAQEKKFQDDLKAKNLTINTLKRELDSKSNNIAFLTTEMHRIKKRVGAEEENLSENINSPTVIPIPPRDGVPRIRRSLYKKGEGLGVSTQSTVMVRRHMRGNSSKSRTSARSDSPVDIPDPSPFLLKNSAEKREVRIKPTPPPLPPIAAQAIHNARHSTGQVVFRSARHDVRGGGPVRAPANSSPEVETLAVDQVPGTTGKWGRAHESHSSEYN